jgi:hypothetical protein
MKDSKKPAQIAFRKEVYVVAVLRILDRDAYGRPKGVMFLHDDESVDVQGGEEFMTCFVPQKMVAKVTS